MNRNLSVGDLLSNYKNSMKIATHDNPIFKSVPATGPRGDQPAGQQWKDLLKEGKEVIGNIIHCLNYKSRLTKENARVDLKLTYDK